MPSDPTLVRGNRHTTGRDVGGTLIERWFNGSGRESYRSGGSVNRILEMSRVINWIRDAMVIQITQHSC
jgi:hypothetical protein